MRRNVPALFRFYPSQKSPAATLGEAVGKRTSMNIIIHRCRRLRPVLTYGLMLTLSALLLTSCHTAGTLQVSAVTYQSINTKVPQPGKNEPIPASAKILASYAIDENGKLAVFVKNLTDEILIIDQEMSFFINTDGRSISYFDPTVRSNTTTDFSSGTSGASMNLGAIASAFGVGGPLGTLMGGISVGGSSTSGVSTSNTVYIADQKRINIGPRGGAAMSKIYPVAGIGKNSVSPSDAATLLTFKQSPRHFSVCISYSLDDGKTFEKLVTDFYLTASIYVPVENQGMVNAAMRRLIGTKSDLLAQPWYLIYLQNNIADTTGDDFYIPSYSTKNVTFDNIVQGMMYDYQ